MNPLTKAKKVAKLLGIIIKPINKYMEPENDYKFKNVNPKDLYIQGGWKTGRTVYIGDKATSYTVLHEIGHVINGYMCCKEHCEYAAHGATLALAKVFNIKLPSKSKTCIDVYAGCSSHKACGAMDKK